MNDTDPYATLAARIELWATIAAGTAGCGPALLHARAHALGVPGSQLEVFEQWAALAAGQAPVRGLRVAATPLLGVILERLLARHDFDGFESLLPPAARLRAARARAARDCWPACTCASASCNRPRASGWPSARRARRARAARPGPGGRRPRSAAGRRDLRHPGRGAGPGAQRSPRPLLAQLTEARADRLRRCPIALSRQPGGAEALQPPMSTTDDPALHTSGSSLRAGERLRQQEDP